MKNNFKNSIYRMVICMFVIMLVSCEDYLQPPTEAETTKSDAFTTYVDFQGFEDQLYGLMVDYFNITMGSSPNTDDFNYRESEYGVYDFSIGNYWYIYNSPNNLSNRRNHWTGKSNKGKGIWIAAWEGIRIANMALENMELLIEATQEERELLLGQAYFFRAFYHWEIIRSWSGVPYITKVFGSSDDMNLTWENTGRRPHFQEVIEPLVDDLDSAAKYLPVDWSLTSVGADVTSDTESQMHGRATKGAAYGIKAKALLFAASPLMNKEHNGTATYNVDLCKRAAEAANEVIVLADQQVYELLPWNDYNRLFYTKNKESMFTPEVIWGKVRPWRVNKDAMWNIIGALHSNNRWNGKSDGLEAPTQNIVDLFEMNNGLPISESGSGYDENDPWVNRDPRFYESILLDGTVWATDGSIIETFKGGLDYGERGSRTGYLCRKYWPQNWSFNKGSFRGFGLQAAYLRLADLYLLYAEAVNEAWDPNTLPTFENGKSGISAVEAVNRVRRRVLLPDSSPFPDVDARYTASKDLFRERIRNERNVELCFEGHRWDDMRRWYIGHELKNRKLYGLEFDQAHSYFKRFVLMERVFEEQHYWLPFDRDLVNMYEGFKQNPGW